MGSRDKDTRSLQDKFKVFFKKGASAPLPARHELIVSQELERDMSSASPQHRRLRVLKDISEKALNVRIQEGGVERIWACTRDLLDDPNIDARHSVLSLMRSIAEGQDGNMLIMRTIYFHYLRDTHTSHMPEDTLLRFKLLCTLTNTGKNLICFEEQMGPFMLEWLPTIQSPTQTVEFLQLVTNVVKFNASYLDEDVVHGIVECSCRLLVWSGAGGVSEAALGLLSAVAAYSLLPPAALPILVRALAAAANHERHCASAWKLMRSVLGAATGALAATELARACSEAEVGGAGVARGAVLWLSLAAWGAAPTRVTNACLTPLAVLPALHQAVRGGHLAVVFEVVLALHSLVLRAPADLDEVSWDLFLAIAADVIAFDASLEPPDELLHGRLHSLLSAVEDLHEAGHYSGEPDTLLDLLESCSPDRPVASALRVVTWSAQRARAAGAAWTAAARRLAQKHLQRETRPAVRLHALNELDSLMALYMEVHGAEAAGRAGLGLAKALAVDESPLLRRGAARLLGALALAPAPPAPPPDHDPTPNALAAADLLDLLHRILNRPFEVAAEENDSQDAAVAALACEALCMSCARRLPASGSGPALALRALVLLLDHLALHYRRPDVLRNHPQLRTMIFELVFSLRANEFNWVGVAVDAAGKPSGAGSPGERPSAVACSPLVLCGPNVAPDAEPQAPASPAPVFLPLDLPHKVLVLALSKETEWEVLAGLLSSLSVALVSAAPLFARRPHDLDLLASAVCSMVSDRSLNYPECLRWSGGRVAASTFHAAALGPLASLPALHALLEPHTQRAVVRCLLKHGMVLRSPASWLRALTLWTLEARDTVAKLLPELLLELSKITDTVAIAPPMLDFLSTLTRLPNAFSSFVEDQYMSVFAILLPYTNPSRYNHYVVSLAHHVVAAWFLNCRLSYRKTFVPFIIHGLHNYIIVPFEEQLHKPPPQAAASLNEDSTNRKRSSSLGSRASGMGGAGGGGALSATAAFHMELRETCIDLLARYTYVDDHTHTDRNDSESWMFAGGASTTWLVGHRLITITNSACQQVATRNQLCERCATHCLQAEASPSSQDDGDSGLQSQVSVTSDASSSITLEVKRYSKRSLQHSRSTDTSASSLSSADALAPPASPRPHSRQNSSENSKASDSTPDSHLHSGLKSERLSKEESEESLSFRGSSGGPCRCWCGSWAELRVRTATGDSAFIVRQEGWPGAPLDASEDPRPPPLPSRLLTSASTSASASAATLTSEAEVRPRSGSSSSHTNARLLAHHQHADLHKSSSEGVVGGDRRTQPKQQPRMSTQPINIPGSPQRQSSNSSGENDSIGITEGKSRQPVRRSNSSPEMSSSWKLSCDSPDPPEPPNELCTSGIGVGLGVGTAMGAKGKGAGAKKGDMRVSCEAIPEEMSGTSPHHSHNGSLVKEGALKTDRGTTDADVAAQIEAKSQQTHRAPMAPLSSDAVSGELPPLARSTRFNTISVMSPTRHLRDTIASRSALLSSGSSSAASSAAGMAGRSGAALPSAFLLLQMYHNMSTEPLEAPVPGAGVGGGVGASSGGGSCLRPLKVSGVQYERTLKNLDLIPPLETYKVGVLYVGPGQEDDEVAILRNEHGSIGYCEFLQRLGSLVALGEGPQRLGLFLNVETNGADGLYTYVWQTDIVQLQFHVATAMPTSARDPSCNEKRKYIGNDYVSIVYNDSGKDFNIHTIKGQFNLCVVVVEPLRGGQGARVELRSKEERVRTAFLPHLLAPHHASQTHAPLLARQLALHAALASQISQSLTAGGRPFASNSLERLRLIKRLRARLQDDRRETAAKRAKPYADARHAHHDDFHDYT